MKVDREEKEILEAYDQGGMKVTKPTKAEIARVKVAATNKNKKNRRVTIRLYDHDLKGIQKKAMEKGIPYQTLISGMIHQYVEGDLVESKGG